MAKVTGTGVRTGVIALITLLAAVAAPPARGAKADLAVTKVSRAPAAALTGEAPPLKVTVSDPNWEHDNLEFTLTPLP